MTEKAKQVYVSTLGESSALSGIGECLNETNRLLAALINTIEDTTTGLAVKQIIQENNGRT